MRKAGFLEPRAGERQHLRRLIHADGADGERREQLQHAAGAGAEIEEILDRRLADDLADRGLDALFGNMERAQFIPIRRMGGEIAGRLFGALAAHFGEPRTIAGEHGIVGGEPGENIAAERGGGAAMRHQEKRPGAFAMALDEPGFDQKLQMPRDARLRLAENGDELADGQLRLGKEREQAQPRLFARGGEGGEERVEGGGRGLGHFWAHPCPEHIKICLYCKVGIGNFWRNSWSA